MDEEQITLSYSLYSNKGIFALLLGSGISRSASIPTGWEIIIDSIKQLAALENVTIEGAPEKWYFEKYRKEPDYSALLQQLTGSKSERTNALKRYFEPNVVESEDGLKQPTAAHRAIAKLVKKSYIKVIVTPNFDRLLENAIKDEGLEVVVIANPKNIENVQPLIHNPITIIKVNGDYLDTDFLNLKSELSEYDPRMKTLLASVFESFGLITCGWSAAWDIALIDILKSSNKFRYSNYFTYLSQPSADLRELADFRQGKLLKIVSADNFFSELLINIESLETLNSNHPKTKELAIARLKKLMAKDEYRIELHDFIYGEVDQLFNLLRNWPHPQSTYSNLKSAVELFFLHTDLVVSLMANAMYFGNPNQHELWFKALTKLSSPKHRSPVMQMWEHFDYLPAMIVFYSLGLAAIIKGDFSFIRKLFGIKKSDGFRNELHHITYYLDPTKLIEKDNLQKAFNVTQYVPMSELLFNKLMPVFTNLVANQEEYINAFDYFEYIFCLAYNKNTDEHYNRVPYGRFAYRRRSHGYATNIVTLKIEEAKIQKENFELIGKPFLKDYKEFETLSANIDEFLKDIHF